jgi:YbbR domain-containing protein
MSEIDRSWLRNAMKRVARSRPGDVTLIVTAFVLAVMVWVAATVQENPFVEAFLPEAIPVEVLNRGEGLVIAGSMEQKVRIEVRAPESVWTELQASSFRAYVDLKGLDVGLHEVSVQVQPARDLVRITQISPAVLTVRLDRSAEKTVEVRVSVYGDPPQGYYKGAPQITPDQVTVTGPESVVDQVTQVTADVYVRGEKDTFERSVQVVPRDEVGTAITGVEIDHPSVTITVPIEQRVGYRELSIRTVIEGTPAAGYWISSISTDPSTVSVFGNPASVGEIPGYLETYPVNVEGARSRIAERVAIVFPEGVSPLEDLRSVQVLIDISPVLGGQTVQLTPVVQGLGRGLEATFSPETVEVILSGPLSELEALEAGDVLVILDLSDYEAGTHLVRPKVEKPESLQVQAILPDQVEVVITGA